ncbi:MAG: hypothetical protein M0D57_08265 [Sphingobacteriales bacterium JAD_PAG50586_3]|nr:MAG: hypothetical protein M0D57_08265 [Sphingobacteriales bacterium JAD_PAG50586_3]
MEINYIYKKKYKNGLYDYTDADGNIIDYDDGKYTREEQYYIDTTPEEREEERVKSAQRKELYKGFVKTQGKMFLVNEVASDNHPAFQAPLLKRRGLTPT